MDKYPKVTFVHYRVVDERNNPFYEGGSPTLEKRGRPSKLVPYVRGNGKKDGWGKMSPRGGKTICKIDFGGGGFAVLSFAFTTDK